MEPLRISKRVSSLRYGARGLEMISMNGGSGGASHSGGTGSPADTLQVPEPLTKRNLLSPSASSDGNWSVSSSDNWLFEALCSYLLPWKHTTAYLIKCFRWEKPTPFLGIVLTVNLLVFSTLYLLGVLPIITLTVLLVLSYALLVDQWGIVNYTREILEHYTQPEITPSAGPGSALYAMGVAGVDDSPEKGGGRERRDSRVAPASSRPMTPRLGQRQRSSSFSGMPGVGPGPAAAADPDSVGVGVGVSMGIGRAAIENARDHASREWFERRNDGSSTALVEWLVGLSIALGYDAASISRHLLCFPIGKARGSRAQLRTLLLVSIVLLSWILLSGSTILFVLLNTTMLLPGLAFTGRLTRMLEMAKAMGIDIDLGAMMANGAGSGSGIADHAQAMVESLTALGDRMAHAAALAADVALDLSETRGHSQYFQEQVALLEEELATQAAEYEQEASELTALAKAQLEQVADRHTEVVNVWRAQLQDCQQRLAKAEQANASLSLALATANAAVAAAEARAKAAEEAQSASVSEAEAEAEADFEGQSGARASHSASSSSSAGAEAKGFDVETRKMIIAQLLGAADRVDNCIATVLQLPSERMGEIDAMMADLPPCADQVSVIAGIITGEVKHEVRVQAINSAVRELMMPVGSVSGAVEWMIRAFEEKRMREHMRGLTPRKIEKKKIANRDFDNAHDRLRQTLNSLKEGTRAVVVACHEALGMEPPAPPRQRQESDLAAEEDAAKAEEDRATIALVGRLGDL